MPSLTFDAARRVDVLGTGLGFVHDFGFGDFTSFVTNLGVIARLGLELAGAHKVIERGQAQKRLPSVEG